SIQTSIIPYQYSGSEPAEVPSTPDHLLSSSNNDETDDDSDIDVVTVQFEQSQPRHPATVVYLTQESDEEILDSSQHPAVSTAPPESPAASHFIPCSPPPQVVPPVVIPFRLPSSQYSTVAACRQKSRVIPPPTTDHDYNSTQSHPVHERYLLFEQLRQEAERQLRDIDAMLRWVHYSQQSPVAPPLRHQYGMHHHHQLPEPTPQQPTAYNHPEGRSAMIPPPMEAPSLEAPDEQLMYRPRPRLWIPTNTSQLTFEQ
ncbi:hypothetical protein L9F63_026731, partial [Diploptera punctata]